MRKSEADVKYGARRKEETEEKKDWRDKESKDNEKKFRRDPDSEDDRYREPKYRDRDSLKERDPRQLYKLLVVLRAKQMLRWEVCNWDRWEINMMNHI